MNADLNTPPTDLSSDPLELDEPAVRALDDYWEALRRGEEPEPEQWLAVHQDAPVSLQGDLRLLRALHDTCKLVAEDSTIDRPGSAAGPDSRATPEILPASGKNVLPPGTRVGECVIESLLGAGGMGEVYVAMHQLLRRRVAVKVLPAHRADDPAAVRRFQQEVELLARMEPHPNLVAARHAGIHEGRLYLVMDYVPGEDLAQRVRRGGPLAPAEAVAYLRQAALGLEHAHRHEVVHRDVKPSNLLLTPEGTVKVVDLGLARLAAPRPGADATGSHVILGTPDYLAPEQALSAGRADARSDLYSLGCTAYFLLTGQAPFPTGPLTDKLVAHACQPPEPVAKVRPEVPPAVAAVVDRLLAKDPQDRFPSARALIDALDAAVRPRRPRKWPWTVAAGVLLAAGLGLLLVFALRDRNPAGGKSAGPSRGSRLTGQLIVRVWDEAHTKDGLKMDEPDALPVRNGDRLRFEVKMNHPAHVYLLWLDSEGKVTPLYPWNPATRIVHKDLNVPPPSRPAQAEVSSPGAGSGGAVKGWKMAGKSGLDTILLLVRRTPLPADVALAQVVGKFPLTPFREPHEWAVRGFDGDQPVGLLKEGADRGPEEEAEKIDDPLLQLMGRLREHFEVVRAVRFAHQGK